MKQTLLRQLPKVDELLMAEALVPYLTDGPRSLAVTVIREELDDLRQFILNTDEAQLPKTIDQEALVKSILEKLHEESLMNLRPVVNATGVILHTNLGRSLLAPAILEHMSQIAGRYSTLEYNAKEGTRGSRYAHVEKLICTLTGAEAALVVNNNAAAVLLVLDTLTKHKEVVVSRGQLVEIGGSFRIPDVMARSQAFLKEIGTTNKTHKKDYESAITENTGALMKIHTSNFKIFGFTEEVSLSDMVAIAKPHGIPVIDDLGSGTLVDISQFGLSKEPTVQDSVQSGADIVTFSGDKLLGGPQAGIIVGKKTLIDQMKKNQLTRALRVDKLTLSALEATLRIYLDPEKAKQSIPTLRMMGMPYDTTLGKAKAFLEKSKLLTGLNDKYSFELEDGYSEVGGGSLPTEVLPSALVKIKPLFCSVQKTADYLRLQDTPIVVRIQSDWVVIDFRTLQADEEDYILEVLQKLSSHEGGKK